MILVLPGYKLETAAPWPGVPHLSWSCMTYFRFAEVEYIELILLNKLLGHYSDLTPTS